MTLKNSDVSKIPFGDTSVRVRTHRTTPRGAATVQSAAQNALFVLVGFFCCLPSQFSSSVVKVLGKLELFFDACFMTGEKRGLLFSVL